MESISGIFCSSILKSFRIDCLKVADTVNGLNGGAQYPTFYNSKGRQVKNLEAFLPGAHVSASKNGQLGPGHMGPLDGWAPDNWAPNTF